MKSNHFIASAALVACSTMAVAQVTVPTDSAMQVSLNEIEVVATRASQKTPVAFSNVSKEYIEAVNYGPDIPQLLSSLPSITTTSDAGAGIGYTSIRVRGTDPSRINITANGVPLNDSESSLVYFSNMGDFASSLESIQLQRGVGTTTNGAGAFGATVNMLTEGIKSKAFAGVDFSAGSYGTNKETLRFGTGLMGGHIGIQGRLSHIGSDGYIDRASSALNSYFVQAGWFGNHTTVKFITFNGTERTYMAWNYTSKYEQSLYGRTYNSCGLYYDSEGNMNFYKNQYDNYHQQHYQLHWSQYINNRWNTNVALHYTHDNYDYDQMKTGKKLHEWLLTTDTKMRGDLVQRKAGKKDFYGIVASANYDNHYGVTMNMGLCANHFDASRTGTVLWVGTPYYKGQPEATPTLAALQPNHRYYDNTSNKTDVSIFTKVGWEFMRGLTAFADIQYRHAAYKMDGPTGDWGDDGQIRLDLSKKFDFFNPKVGLNYEIAGRHRLYASYGISHREPTRDHYEEHLYEEIHAERMGDIEIGYKYSGSIFSAGINLYHMHYKDQFVLTGELDDEGVAITKNIDKSYRMGTEVVLSLRPTEWFNWEANATLSRNRAKDMKITLDDYTTVVNVGETPLSFSPSFIFNNIFTFSYKGLRAIIQSQYVSEQYLTNYGVKNMTCWSDWSQTPDVQTNETLMLGAHFTTNLDLSYSFSLPKIALKSATIGVTMYNLFSAKYDNNGWAAPQFRQNADGSVYAVNTWGLRDSEAVGFAPSAPFNVLAHLSLTF